VSKFAKELVLDEHGDGSAHITVDEAGKLKHYARGCPVQRGQGAAARASSGGPPKVTSDAYRAGWDAVSWGAKPSGAPS
jgi:hypothetical protein